MSLEDSLEEEIPNWALKRANSSEEQQQGRISGSLVPVRTMDGRVCRARTPPLVPNLQPLPEHTL